MRKYKINRDGKPKLPPLDVINKHKDFQRLRTKYDDITKPSGLPLYKNRKLFLFLLIIGLLAWLIAESLQKDEKQMPNNEDKTEQTSDK